MAAVLLLYFNISGGPIGAEPIMSSAGPLAGIVGLCAFPFLWSLQVSLMTAELSSAFPTNGGYSVWVTEAMGEMWGYQESYYSWLSGVTDNALYPGLIWSLVQPLFNMTTTAGGGPNGTDPFFPPIDDDSNSIFEADLLSEGGLAQVGIKIALACVMAVPNFFLVGGIDRVLIFVVVATAVPFLAFAIMCVPHMELSNLAEYNLTLPNTAAMVQNLFWNLNGADSISTAAGEVINPALTISTALFIALPLISVLLAIPLIAAAGVNKPVPWQQWQDGQFTVIAQYVGGKSGGLLSLFIGVAAAVGGCGLFVTELLEDSYQIHGMAECGMVPVCFSCRSKRFRTPVPAIVLSLFCVVGLQFFNLVTITTYTNVLSCAAVLLELTAFFVLRYKQPDLRRKFRVAGPMWWIWLLFAPAFAMAIFVMGAGCFSSWQIAVPNVIVLGLGFAVYGCMKAARLSYMRVRSDTDESDDGKHPPMDVGGHDHALATKRAAPPGIVLPNLAAEGEEVVVDPFIRAISGHDYAAPPLSPPAHVAAAVVTEGTRDVDGDGDAAASDATVAVGVRGGGVFAGSGLAEPLLPGSDAVR